MRLKETSSQDDKCASPSEQVLTDLGQEGQTPPCPHASSIEARSSPSARRLDPLGSASPCLGFRNAPEGSQEAQGGLSDPFRGSRQVLAPEAPAAGLVRVSDLLRLGGVRSESVWFPRVSLSYMCGPATKLLRHTGASRVRGFWALGLLMVGAGARGRRQADRPCPLMLPMLYLIIIAPTSTRPARLDS